MREIISTKDAPQAIGPYSQAIKANGFVFMSGQIAIDPTTQQIIAGDVAAQTDRVLRNLSEILEAADSGLGKVVRSYRFPEEHERLAAMNQVYGQYFSSDAPARCAVTTTSCSSGPLAAASAARPTSPPARPAPPGAPVALPVRGSGDWIYRVSQLPN